MAWELKVSNHMTRTRSSLAKGRVTTEDPDLVDRFDRVLGETVGAMEESGIRYAFIGGIASSGLGRPRSTHDIDLFVRPEDAEVALRSLARHGFRVERTDPVWLYKGFKEGILVDVIFRSKGEIYFDQEMYQKMTIAEYHGKMLRLIGPEDLLIIKAVAHSELTPGHWHDAIGLLTHARLDWKYLIKRARRAPRRILSLLLYAQSNDIWVPNQVIEALYKVIFEGAMGGVEREKTRPVFQNSVSAPLIDIGSGEGIPAVSEYQLAHLRERLAENLSTNELDIQVELRDGRIVLKGQVTVVDRKMAAEEIARKSFPGLLINNEIQIVACPEPPDLEELK